MFGCCAVFVCSRLSDCVLLRPHISVLGFCFGMFMLSVVVMFSSSSCWLCWEASLGQPSVKVCLVPQYLQVYNLPLKKSFLLTPSDVRKDVGIVLTSLLSITKII